MADVVDLRLQACIRACGGHFEHKLLRTLVFETTHWDYWLQNSGNFIFVGDLIQSVTTCQYFNELNRYLSVCLLLDILLLVQNLVAIEECSVKLSKCSQELTFFLTHCSNSVVYAVTESGDDIGRCVDDESLIISNHQSTSDVPLLICLIVKHSVAPQVYWIMDDIFRFVPFGWVSFVHGDFFIKQVSLCTFLCDII